MEVNVSVQQRDCALQSVEKLASSEEIGEKVDDGLFDNIEAEVLQLHEKNSYARWLKVPLTKTIYRVDHRRLTVRYLTWSASHVPMMCCRHDLQSIYQS